MNLEKIKTANTKYLGKNVVYLKQTNSTQEVAKKLIKQEIENGSVIITDNQLEGKGTKGRKWITSKEKNIMMTIVLYPNTKVYKLEGLTIKIAQAIKEAIKQLYGYMLTIKEPNDLYLNGKKIAGILTQSTSLQEQVKNLYIGIGFNVNEDDFPKELEIIATSLKKEYQKNFEREEIIGKILEEIEKIV